jgi:hypothetical protein
MASLNGDTGISAGMSDALAGIVGDARTIRSTRPSTAREMVRGLK